MDYDPYRNPHEPSNWPEALKHSRTHSSIPYIKDLNDQHSAWECIWALRVF